MVRAVGAWLALVSLWLPATPARADGAASDPVALEGAWYVLVHHRDAGSEDDGSLRWEDALWVFERRGERLSWTVHPRPRFEDTRGRADAVAWQPDAAQRAEIARGLRADGRGALSASLRGSDARGWSSGGRVGPGSPFVVGFARHWSIDGPNALPVFIRRERLDGVGADALEGETRHETTAREGPDALAGVYTRDGERRGRFWMWRSGGAEKAGEPAP